ncbi:alpha/beta hydrolase [Saccharopolyspora rectivirgula]|jgi:alpha-beta hydrolase superfamily lysophospholipase|uniref:Lysophospholipase n=1 Tax=Saccharopolyspora rectivirgula TaxID=28042 RepID=A0A073B2I8_9PSEU|nr:alpha/beta hydrolase [Saccharopolyspora rectivirgula]KEI45497.1 lysophospholipase [Saccharopolyspora rectivirgula]
MIEPTDREVPCLSGDLVVRKWAASEPNWVALLAHGYGEHSGRYQWIAEQLVADGAVVFAPDHAGHGRSPGKRVYIKDADTIVADLEAVRKQIADEYPDLPLVLMGHSLGGMFAVRYAQLHQEHLSAIVLSAPVLGTWHVLDLLEHDEIPDTPIDPETLSRDPKVGQEYKTDPLVWHGPYRRTTLKAIDRCLTAINDGPQLDKPTLWIHGEEDELVPEADTRTGIDRIRGERFHEHIYPGARHELLNETNRDEVLDEVLTFIHRALRK